MDNQRQPSSRMFKDLEAVGRSSRADNDATISFVTDQLVLMHAERAVAGGLPLFFPPPPLNSAATSLLMSTMPPSAVAPSIKPPFCIRFSTLPSPKSTLPFSARPSFLSALRYDSPKNWFLSLLRSFGFWVLLSSFASQFAVSLSPLFRFIAPGSLLISLCHRSLRWIFKFWGYLIFQNLPVFSVFTWTFSPLPTRAMS